MPARPTPPPARRSATLPAGQRWIAPIAIPIACRHPVAIDEADAVEKPALTRREFSAVRVAMEDREKANDSAAATYSGGLRSIITATPSMMADAAMPISTPGSGTPTSPSKPPKAMTSGNVTGSSQIAGAPSCAPQRPDGDHREDVVESGDRMQEPGRNPSASPD